MKTTIKLIVTTYLLSVISFSAFAQGTAFSYQGRLNDGGSPAGGIYDLRFTIYDAFASGNVVAGPLTNSATGVTNGLFAVTLDFGGGVFTGSNRWVEIAARTNGASTFTMLTPRQPIQPVPYAIMANSASNLLGTIANGALPASPSFSGTVTAGSFSGSGANLTSLNANNLVSGTVPLAQLSGITSNQLDAATWQLATNLNGGNAAVATNVVSGIAITNAFITNSVFAGNGKGLTNLNASQLSSGTIPLAELPAAVITNNSANLTIGGTNAVAPLTVPLKVPSAAIGSVGTVSHPLAVAVAGRYAYVASGQGGTLQIFDVSTPSGPTLVGSVSDGVMGNTRPMSIAVAGGFAYVPGNGSTALWVFDVSTPSAPANIGGVNGMYGYTLAVAGRYAYEGAYIQGLRIIDLSIPSAPVIVGVSSTGGSPSSVAVAGRYAYLVDRLGGTLQVINVSIPTAPVSAGSPFSLGGGSSPYSVAVSGRYAYVANYGSNTLQVIDVSNPATPVSAGSVATGSGPQSLAVAGRYAYVVNYTANTLQIFDVSTPAAPVSVGSVATGSGPSSLAVAGRYAYVVNYTANTLQIFDLGGAYVQQLEAGAMETGTLQTRDTITAGNNLDVRGGLTVSASARISGGLNVDNGTIAGDGSGLINLNASQLSGGTVPLAQLSGITGSQLDAATWQQATNLNGGNAALATNLVAGIAITNAFITNSVFAGNGAGLTNLNASQLSSGTIPLTRLPGAVVTNNNTTGVTLSGTFTGTFSGDGSGLTGINGGGGGSGVGNVASGQYATIAGGYYNTASSPEATIGGGASNNIWILATNSFLGGGEFNNIQPYAQNSTIAGGAFNSIELLAGGSTLGGGISNNIQVLSFDSFLGGGYQNSIFGACSTLGGGWQNSITNAGAAMLGGGFQNTIQAGYSALGGGFQNNIQSQALYSTLGGGYQNTIQTNAQYATIAGGRGNIASNLFATVSGGDHNTASGPYAATVAGGYGNVANNSYATVAGGWNNVAGGEYSFAAGRGALALHDGAFVWADSIGGQFASTANNQFLIQAAGGVGIGTNRPASALHVNGTVTATSFSGNGALPWQIVPGTSVWAEPNNGYVVNNSALTTISLDASILFNLGDVVRISCPGAGGWKLAQNGDQSIRVNNAALMAVGVNWIAHASAGTRAWSSVASSADGTKLAAAAGILVSVGGEGIVTSTDSGATWHQQTDSEHFWQAVASSADGIKLVAACPVHNPDPDDLTAGYIYTSADSGALFSHTSVASWTWKSVASSADGTKLVAVQSLNSFWGTGDGRLYTSTDSGATWSNHNNSPASANWSAVAASTDGSKMVAVVNGGQIYTSADSGSTWVAQATAQNWTCVASSSDGTKLVAAGSSGPIYTSQDAGVTWGSSPNSPSCNWASVASSADGSKLVAAAGAGGQIFISSDSGMTWTPQAFGANWACVASSSDGTKLVAAVSDSSVSYTGGSIYTSAPVSTTPNSTTTRGTGGYLVGGQGTTIELQYIGNGQFLPISHEGLIFAY